MKKHISWMLLAVCILAEKQIQTMGLSKEKRKMIDVYVTEVSERWILYAESLYQAGMQKILELLNL